MGDGKPATVIIEVRDGANSTGVRVIRADGEETNVPAVDYPSVGSVVTFEEKFDVEALIKAIDPDHETLIKAAQRLFAPDVIDLLAEAFCSREVFARKLSSFEPKKQEQYRNSALHMMYELARHMLDNRMPDGTTWDKIGIPTTTEEIGAV